MNHAHHDHAHHGHPHGGHSSPPATAERVTDPVCGMQVDPATSTERAQHAGKTYYFCCDGCRNMFAADPAKYLAKQPVTPAAAPVVTAAAAGAQYTCPMHPEIVQDGPGSCPKCGMPLVPIAGTGETDDSELRNLTWRLWAGVALSARRRPRRPHRDVVGRSTCLQRQPGGGPVAVRRADE